MTIDIIITELLDELERPDLYITSEGFIPASIRAAHACRKFYKDVAKVVMPDPTIDDNSRVRYSLVSDLPRLREVKGVKLFATYTEPTPGVYVLTNEIALGEDGFKDRGEMNDVTDYYGNRYRHLFSLAGDELLLQGVDPSTTAIELEVLQWPTVTRGTFTGILTTSSWIVREFPELVKAHLRKNLARTTSRKVLMDQADSLIAIHQTDLVNANSKGFY